MASGQSEKNCGEGIEMPMSVEDMSRYREEQAARRLLKQGGQVVDDATTHKKEKLEEIASTKQWPGGDFRKHKPQVKPRARRRGIMARLEGSDEFPLSAEEMQQYREEMAARKQLKKEKTEKLLKL